MREFCSIEHPAYLAQFELHAKKDGHVSIYALVDPRDRTVRYVGKTVDPEMRFSEHVQHTHFNPGLRGWIEDLASENLSPELIVLQLACHWTWQDAERSWIAFARNFGAVYNIEDGGITRGKSKRLRAKREKFRLKAAANFREKRAELRKQIAKEEKPPKPEPVYDSPEMERDCLAQPPPSLLKKASRYWKKARDKGPVFLTDEEEIVQVMRNRDPLYRPMKPAEQSKPEPETHARRRKVITVA